MHRMFRQAYNKKFLANWEECHMLNFSIIWNISIGHKKIWSCTVQKWKYKYSSCNTNLNSALHLSFTLFYKCTKLA